MKKLLLAASAVIVLVTSSFTHAGIRVTKNIQKNFEAHFGITSGVEWSSTADYATATFILNDQRMKAYYKQSGKLVGTSQAITLDHLPGVVKNQFKKQYGEFNVLEVLKFTGEDEMAFFISIQKGRSKMILKVVNDYITIF